MEASIKPADEASLWLQDVKEKASREAFVRLFNFFAPRIKSYLRRQGLENAAAEDLTQDVMLQLWNRAGSYDAKKARASTWVFTIARNRLIDFWRQKKDFTELTEANAQSYEPQSDIDTERDNTKLREAIADLPEAQRDLVEDSFFDDQSHQMISAARKIPLGTVKSRLRLALDRLRKNITSSGEGSA